MSSDLAGVRKVEAEGGCPRPFDLEVTSDGGKTWKTLPTKASHLLGDDVVRVGVPVHPIFEKLADL